MILHIKKFIPEARLPGYSKVIVIEMISKV